MERALLNTEEENLSDYDDESEYELEQPGNSTIPNKIKNVMGRIPWMTVFIVGACLSIFIGATWYQIEKVRQISAYSSNDQPFELTKQGDVICQSAMQTSKKYLWMKTQTLFLVLSIPVSMASLMGVTFVLFHRYCWSFTKRMIRFLDSPLPPVEYIFQVPGRVWDRSRKAGGILNIIVGLLILTYIPYKIFTGYVLDQELELQSIPNYDIPLLKTDIMVAVSTEGKYFCSCAPNLNNSCDLPLDSYNCTQHITTEGNYEFFVTVLTGTSMNALTSVYLGGDSGGSGSFKVSWGMHNYLVDSKGSFTSVFSHSDQLQLFPDQSYCDEFSDFAPISFTKLIALKKSASCEQSLYDTLFGSYNWGVSYYTASFNVPTTKNPYSYNSPTEQFDLPHDGNNIEIMLNTNMDTVKDESCTTYVRSLGSYHSNGKLYWWHPGTPIFH